MASYIRSHRPQFVLVLISIVLIYISPFSAMARGYINEAISSSLGLFAMARVANAGISVLQSAQASSVIASVGVGEVLDPLNDVIENFSTLVTWAIGALFGQMFALDLAETLPIGIAISTIGALSLILGGFGASRASSVLWTLFLSFFLARIALVLSIYLSMWISHSILDKRISDSKPQLEELNRTIDQLTGVVQEELPENTSIDDMKSELQKKEALILESSKALDKLNLEREPIYADSSYFPRWIAGENVALEDVDRRISEIESNLEEQTSERDTLKIKIDCIDLQQNGESCQSMLSRIKNFDIWKLGDVASASVSMINDLLLLSAALLLKSVIMPILSGLVLLRLIRPAVSTLRLYFPENTQSWKPALVPKE